MKMKSKFFGLNAKLALAVLAVGTMFTSCYDSENGDVTQPYQAPDAVYTFTGTVTSQLTGKGVAGATVTFSGAVTGTVNTDATGTYQYTTTDVAAGQTAVNIVVSGDNFENKSAAVEGFKPVEKGQSVIFFTNVMVQLTDFEEEGLEFEASVGLEGDENVVISGDPENPNYDDDYKGIDLVNKTGIAQKYTRTFTVSSGTKVAEDKGDVYGYNTRALTDDIKQAIQARINAALGEVPQADYGTAEQSVDIYLDNGYALGSVSIQYNIQTLNFDYSYGEDNGTVVVNRIVSAVVTPNIIPAEFYHGHGHGHGDDPNAGGGITVPEL